MPVITSLTHTENGNTAVFKPSTSLQKEPNTYTFYAVGTWDTATAKIQISPDDGATWLDFTSGSMTTDGYIVFTVKASQIRINISSIGATTDLDIFVF